MICDSASASPRTEIGASGSTQSNLNPLGFQMRAEGLRGAADHPGQVARLEVVFLLAAFHAREIQHVVDEPGEPRGLGGDDVQVGTLLGRVGHAALGEQFGEHADGRERRLQFVRDVADEIGFLPRQFQFGIQAADDEPASDADGEHQHGDEQAEREFGGVRRLSEPAGLIR